MRNRYNKDEPKITKNRYGSWRVRFFDNEKGKYKDKNCKTKTDAENLKRALCTGLGISRWFPKNKPNLGLNIKSFKDLSEKWIEHGRYVRRITESCLGNYKTHLKHHILPLLGHIKLNHLHIEHIESLAKELLLKKAKSKSYSTLRKNRKQDLQHKEKLSLSYQREILTTVCMITSWGSSRNLTLLEENPFCGFKLPNIQEYLYAYWKLEEEDAFLDWLESGAYYEKETSRYKYKKGKKYTIKLQLRNHEELRDIVLFALRTAMRIGEIGGIRKKDINLEGGFLIVRSSYCSKEGELKDTTKSKKPRIIEINEDVREILSKRLEKPADKALFNIHMNSIKYFARTCEQAQVKEIHFHSLRHTCLTNLANGYGMVHPLPLPKVQQIAGHSNIKTTMRYVHADSIKETASLQFSRKKRKERTTKLVTRSFLGRKFGD